MFAVLLPERVWEFAPSVEFMRYIALSLSCLCTILHYKKLSKWELNESKRKVTTLNLTLGHMLIVEQLQPTLPIALAEQTQCFANVNSNKS
jgi:hypothetical protein